MGNSLAATSLKAIFLPPPAATNCQRLSRQAAGPVSIPSHPWLRIASVLSCPSNCSCCELLSATAMLFTDDSIPWPFFPSPESYCSLSPPSSLAFPQLWKGQCECPVEGRAFNSLFFLMPDHRWVSALVAVHNRKRHLWPRLRKTSVYRCKHKDSGYSLTRCSVFKTEAISSCLGFMISTAVRHST